MRSLHRELQFAVIVCFVTFANRSYAAQEGRDVEAAGEVARLEAIWQDWGEKVHSMEANGYKFIGSSGRDGFTRDVVQKFVFETFLPNVEPGKISPDSLASLTQGVFSDKPDKDRLRPAGRWRPFRVVEDSGAVRADEEINGLKQVTIRKDGGETQYWEGARQISLFTKRTGLRIPTIETFLHKCDLPEGDNLDWRLTSPAGNRTQRLEFGDAEGPAVSVDYDRQTGFLKHYAFRLSKDRYRRERIQSHPITTSLGIPVPQIVIDFFYSPPRGEDSTVVRGLTIHAIDHIDLNPSVAPERFQFVAPPGTHAVKFNGAEKQSPP